MRDPVLLTKMCSYLPFADDLYLVQPPEVEVHTALLDALTGVAVAATPHAQLQAGRTGRPHGPRHVQG